MENNIKENLLKLKSPRWIVFQLLEECNLRCKMCYEWGDTGAYHSKGKLKQLDLQVIKEVINQCKEYKPYFELFGGEPLMYPYFEEVLKEIKESGCMVDISTNGTLLESKLDILLKYPPRRIWVSLDGPKEVNDFQRGQGVYEKAVKGLQTLYSEREKRNQSEPFLGLTMVVTPDNYMYVEQLFIKEIDIKTLDWISIEFQLYTTEEKSIEYERVLKDQFSVNEVKYIGGLVRNTDDFKSINIQELIRQVNVVRSYCTENDVEVIGYPQTLTEDNLKNFYTANWDKMEDKKSKCSFPWLYVEIQANGDVVPCHTFYDFNIGNVYNHNILEIWSGKELKMFKEYTKNKLLPICSACSRYYTD